MSILVTGANGFIGEATCAVLHRAITRLAKDRSIPAALRRGNAGKLFHHFASRALL